jgi:hypothetical protein
MKLWTFGIGASAALLLLLLPLFLHGPAAPVGRENGAFTQDCCGTLTLRNGGMVLNGKQTVPYVVGEDSRGPYILPSTYVGPFEYRGFEVDGSRPAAKLRLDRLPKPTRILLDGGAKSFLFKRKG